MKQYLLIIFTYLISISLCFGSFTIPFDCERLIAQEYNKITHNNPAYISIPYLLQQTLDGKSIQERYQIIHSLKNLDLAVNRALFIIRSSGKSLWYWAYIIKDNQSKIDLLVEISQAIRKKINTYTWENKSDLTKLSWYITSNLGVAALGILALYASKAYLPDNKNIKDLALHEMLLAPIFASYDLALHAVHIK
jgi:hypothetical protein